MSTGDIQEPAVWIRLGPCCSYSQSGIQRDLPILILGGADRRRAGAVEAGIESGQLRAHIAGLLEIREHDRLDPSVDPGLAADQGRGPCNLRRSEAGTGNALPDQSGRTGQQNPQRACFVHALTLKKTRV
ncbi:hypothetical protein D3C81_1090600 [compost metagenome]